MGLADRCRRKYWGVQKMSICIMDSNPSLWRRISLKEGRETELCNNLRINALHLVLIRVPEYLEYHAAFPFSYHSRPARVIVEISFGMVCLHNALIAMMLVVNSGVDCRGPGVA